MAKNDAASSADFTFDAEQAILVIGDQLSPEDAARLLCRSLPEPSSAPRGAAVVLAAGEAIDLFEPFVAAGAIYYISRALPPIADSARLLGAAVRARSGGEYRDEVGLEIGTQVDELLQELDRQKDSAVIARRIAKEIEVLLKTSSAFVWFYDRAQDLLWRPADWTAKEKVRKESAAAGLIGYVARTGASVVVPSVGDDPRFDPEADNDHGPRDQRLLASAVVDNDPHHDRRVGVLVGLRLADKKTFDESDQERLDYLARRLSRIATQVTERHERESHQQVISEQAAAIFRREALEHYSRSVDFTGRALEISPAWMRRAVWLVAAAALTAVLFAATVRVDESVGAPAIVTVSGGEARVLGLLPASSRPLLEEGMPLRVQLDGFGEIARTKILTLSGVLSPQEAHARVDERFHATLRLDGGPVVLVETRLDGARFNHNGRDLELYDGLPGRIELVVDSSPVLESLLPGSR